jgi:hypothetical protein
MAARTSMISRAWFAAGIIIVSTATSFAVPGAAVAHGNGPAIPDAAYYRSFLADVTPAPAGVVVRVDPAGEWIELSDTGPAVVLVFGYTHEPYLRVTAATVEENELSQTTFLNRSLFADSVPTGSDGSGLAPAWKQISTVGLVRWHDHRIHWMGQNRPPPVAADPRHGHVVGEWTVHALANGVPFEIHGGLRWIGKPDSASGIQVVPEWLLWLVESFVVVIAVVALVLVGRRRRKRPQASKPDDWVHPNPLGSSSLR